MICVCVTILNRTANVDEISLDFVSRPTECMVEYGEGKPLDAVEPILLTYLSVPQVLVDSRHEGTVQG
jgi:hypothetical protein